MTSGAWEICWAGWSRSARCDRWAVVSFSGGMCVLTADSLAGSGARLVDFSAPTKARLADLLPGYLRPNNPLDIGPGSMPAKLVELLDVVAADRNIDGVCFPIPMGARGWYDAIMTAVTTAGRHGKPILVGWYGGEPQRVFMHRLELGGALVVETPSEIGRTVRTLLSATAARPGREDAAAKAGPVPTRLPLAGFTPSMSWKPAGSTSHRCAGVRAPRRCSQRRTRSAIRSS